MSSSKATAEGKRGSTVDSFREIMNPMDPHTRRTLKLLVNASLIGGLAGVAYMPVLSDVISLEVAALFAAQGILITVLVMGFEFFVMPAGPAAPLRRAPFAVTFAVKSLVTTVLIVIAIVIGGLVLFPGRFESEAPVRNLLRDTAFSFGVSSVLQFALMIRDIVGGRVLMNLILGRYHRPLTEERIFMFLDVSGSTALAERMGALGAYRMISRFFFDVAQETFRYGGETHEYIGDEVVVTWPIGSDHENARCIDCFFAIADRIDRQADQYEREFDHVPGFRAGIHGGSVVAGECGDDKREIVYFGDTINTAARIQSASKDHDLQLLVSGELMARIALPAGYRASSLGPQPLRGLSNEIELVSITRE